jgi:hypothetical protein
LLNYDIGLLLKRAFTRLDLLLRLLELLKNLLSSQLHFVLNDLFHRFLDFSIIQLLISEAFLEHLQFISQLLVLLLQLLNL